MRPTDQRHARAALAGISREHLARIARPVDPDEAFDWAEAINEAERDRDI